MTARGKKLQRDVPFWWARVSKSLLCGARAEKQRKQ